MTLDHNGCRFLSQQKFSFNYEGRGLQMCGSWKGKLDQVDAATH